VADSELEYEQIRTELSALMSTDRRLHASEERKRQILLEQLERCTTKNRGIERVHEMRAALMAREYPPEIDLKEAQSGNR
jgi:hypothetical protein